MPSNTPFTGTFGFGTSNGNDLANKAPVPIFTASLPNAATLALSYASESLILGFCCFNRL